jgi:cell division protein ZapA
MAQVSLQINGYGYILGCADGEEEHLRALATDLDRRIDEIKASTGPTGEARMLLMAALVLSDELHDLREQGSQPDGDSAPPKSEPKSGRRLRGLAKRAEGIADSAEKLPLSTARAAAANNPPADAEAASPPAATSSARLAPARSRNAPSGDAPSGDAPSGDAPSGDAPSGDAPSGDAPSGDASSDGGPSGDAHPDGGPSGGAPSGGAVAPASGTATTTPRSTPSEPSL